MAMSLIWTGMIALAIVCALLTGQGEAVAAAALEGASAGVELCLSMAGVLCLWMGVMEAMRRSGLARGLSRLLRPVLGRLYPEFAQENPFIYFSTTEKDYVFQPLHAGGVQHGVHRAHSDHCCRHPRGGRLRHPL